MLWERRRSCSEGKETTRTSGGEFCCSLTLDELR